MRRIVLCMATLAGLLAFGTGCEEGTGETVAAGTDCPQVGYVTPSSASLTVTGFSLDGLPLLTGFESTADYDGQPATCFNPDTNVGRLVFTVDDLPIGTITVGGLVEGSFDINGGATTLVITVENDDGTLATFGPGTFQSGSGYVNSITPLDVDVAGTAVSDATSQNMDVTFTALVTP
ncbi:MAG: hypothetical protein ACI8PZ_005947 [Myxococcota bacterium]|jgi:hypothetical protein